MDDIRGLRLIARSVGCTVAGVCSFVAFVLLASSPASANDTPPDRRWLAPLITPPGFEISVFAGDQQAHSIHSLTFDSLGRCVVSGPGYVNVLEDRDDDGRCDFVREYARVGSSGLQGMLFIGRTLYGVDDRGVVRLPDADQDDLADSIQRIGPTMRPGGEHGPHGIVLGPDGWLYVVLGNKSGFTKEQITSRTSPVLNPVQGSIIRMTPDGARCEVVATGFRNPYDLAFNSMGELFTVDSDNEAELGLPFYRYPRLVHVVPGIDAGWRDTDKQWPDYYMDTIPGVTDLGRGSPAGVAVYQHTQFPPKYRGAVLVADWSWARVAAFFLRRSGATWTATREDLVRTPETISTETHGERDYASGFYPTDLAIAPDGSLYISLGGRDTLGVVYRLRYTGQTSEPRVPSQEGVDTDRFDDDVSATHRSNPFPHQAVERWRNEPQSIRLPDDVLEAAAHGGSPEMRARVAETIRLTGRCELAALLRDLANDSDPLVRRRAIEAWPAARDSAIFIDTLVERLDDPIRLCRHAAARALEHIDPTRWREAAARHPSQRVRLWAALVDTWIGRPAMSQRRYVDLVKEFLISPETPEQRLEGLRVLEHLLGRGFVAPAALVKEQPDSLIEHLANDYPTRDRRVNREIASLLVRVNWPRAAGVLLAYLESDAARVEKLHVLSRLARLDFTWQSEPLRRVIRAWLRLVRAGDPQTPDAVLAIQSRWLENSLYWTRFYHDDPATAVDELLQSDNVGGLLAKPLGQLDQQPFTALWPALKERYIHFDIPTRRAILAQLGRWRWPETAAFVRQQVDDPAVRAAALRALAQFGRRQDRPVFLRAVADTDLRTAEAALAAIETLDIDLTPETIFQLINHLSRTVGQPLRERFRDSILHRLEDCADHPPPRRALHSSRDELQTLLDWQEWFIDLYPGFETTFPPIRDPRRMQVDRRNVAGELLRRVDFAKGDPMAGARQFVRLGCTNCHVHNGQGRSLGPDLTGVGQRLSRRDLMEAIVMPSKSVPPQYQYTLLRMQDGQVIGGVIQRQVGDTLYLADAEGDVQEVQAPEIIERAAQDHSLMPDGLLDPASDRDVADLFAFLATGTPADASAD